MKKFFILILGLALAFLAFKTTPPDPATTFLDSLAKDQLKEVQFAFEDASRETWHYLPHTMYERPGILIKDLSDTQKELFFELLQSHVSETGYDKILRIIDLENVLVEMGGDPEFRDAEKYAVAIYGKPGVDELWSWTFEGHHIALSFTIVKGKVSMTPRFLGASPATVPEGSRKGERTLVKEQDLALQLVNALPPEQRKRAIFRAEAYPDIITGNTSTASRPERVGVALSELDENERNLLLQLIVTYLETMPEQLFMEKIQAVAREKQFIHFAWAGATESGKPHYYRIQGESFLIEFDNTQNNANHIHTVWRDFDGDFGRDLLRQHYDAEH